MAPMAAAVAATKNNKQKIRRHLDAVNVGAGFEFLIMEVAGVFGLFDWFLETEARNPLVDKAQTRVKPFLETFIKPMGDDHVISRQLLECDASSHRFCCLL